MMVQAAVVVLKGVLLLFVAGAVLLTMVVALLKPVAVVPIALMVVAMLVAPLATILLLEA
jgi:hypothetical protein